MKMLDIKERFNLLNKVILTKDFLVDLLNKFPEKYSLYDLTRKGIIAVIKRDETYLNLCYDKRSTPWIIGATYCSGVTYMFGGLSVYNLYGFTTQIANQYTIYSDTFYGNRKIHTTDFTFKKVKKDLLYGFEQKFDRGIYYNIMTIERAFIEYCKENNEKLNDLRNIYKTQIDKSELNKLLKKYPYQSVRNFISDQIIKGV